MKFGLQLYEIEPEFYDRPELLFETIAQTGYRRIEPYVIFNSLEAANKNTWTVEYLEKNMFLANKYNLEISSCRVVSSDILKSLERMKALSKQYGIRRFIVECPRGESREKLMETAFAYMKIAEQLHAVGAELLLCNDKESTERSLEGRTIYEWLLDACLDQVYAQVSIKWFHKCGKKPTEFIWRNRKRIKSVLYENPDGCCRYRSDFQSGENADTAECFQLARAAGIDQVMALNGSEHMIEQSRYAFNRLNSLTQYRNNTASYLNILDTVTGEVKVLKRFNYVIEAPNWYKKSDIILYNSGGRLYEYDLKYNRIKKIESGECYNCNNDHAVSFDEKWIAVSNGPTEPEYISKIYILPSGGGTPELVMPESPSFLHGWSPDGSELAYCAFRNHSGGYKADIYTVAIENGEEKRLTNGGFNDGPEYSPDGKYIWFNSTRSGLMQIWRMKRDGSNLEQMTDNKRNNWFAHISPCGDKVVYISYKMNELDAEEHLPNMCVELWMMDHDGNDKKKLLSFFGGQGSINVNSWSADGRRLAFISYELMTIGTETNPAVHDWKAQS